MLKQKYKLNSLFNFLLLVQQTSQLAQVQQKFLVHFGVIVFGSRVLIRVRPKCHYRLGTLEKVTKLQVLQLTLGRLEAQRRNENNGRIPTRQFVR